MEGEIRSKGCLLAFAIGMTITVVGVLINGLVIKSLWGWFIVSTFGLNPLSLRSAIGISLLIGHITRHDVAETREQRKLTWDKFIDASVQTIGTPIIVYVFGYIVAHIA